MKTGCCLHCKTEFEYKPASQLGKYCSNKCQRDFEYVNLVEEWKHGVKSPGSNVQRKYLREKQQGKCLVCEMNEWRGNAIPLEIDHISGDSTDNRIENLRLICPNCHAQTSTYKNKNRGSGRHYRRVRYSQGKSY